MKITRLVIFIFLGTILSEVINGITIAEHIPDHFFDLSTEKCDFSIPVSTFQTTDKQNAISLSLQNPPSWSSYTMENPLCLGHLAMNGDATGVFVKDSVAYVAEGIGGLRLLDVSNVKTPKFISNVDTPGNAKSVTVIGKYSFLADGLGGLKIFDISNQQNPFRVSHFQTNGSAMAISVIGDLAYIAVQNYDYSFLDIIDVDEKSAPIRISSVQTEKPQGLFVSGDYVYVADGASGMKIIDITSKFSPFIIGSCPTWDLAMDIVVFENYAFVADWFGGLVVIDVSVPSNPHIIQNITVPGASSGLCVSGSQLFLTRCYYSGLSIFNISSPMNNGVQYISSIGTGNNAYNVFVETNIAYVADSRDGVLLIDITNITNPIQVSRIDTSGDSKSLFVSDDKDVVFLGDASGGLKIVDFSSYDNIRLVGSLATNGSAEDVYVKDDIAYLAGGAGGFQVINVTDHTNPVLLKSIENGGEMNGIDVLDSYAFVVGSDLLVIDISDPINPVVVGTVSFSEEEVGTSVFAVGTKVYTVGADQGLKIIDVSTPTSPQILGSGLILSGRPNAVWVDESGRYVYISTCTEGTKIVDAINVDDLQVITTLQTGHSCGDICAIDNQYGFVSDSLGEEVYVIDLTNMASPTIVGKGKCTVQPEGVFARGNNLFIAGTKVGVEIMRFGDIKIDLTQPTDIYCGNTSLTVVGTEISTGLTVETSANLYCNDLCPEQTKMKGSCDFSSNECVCDAPTEWYGPQCDEYFCFGKKKMDEDVCNGRGECVGLDNCDCKNFGYGVECEHDLLVFVIILPCALALGIFLIVLVICFCGCCCILVFSSSCLVVVVGMNNSRKVIVKERSVIDESFLDEPLVENNHQGAYGEDDIESIQ